MERTRATRASAFAVVGLLLAGFAPGPADAYPGAVSGFFDGRVNSTVEFQGGPGHSLVGTLRLPSNATVTGANISIEPGAASSSMSFVENATSGFAAGTASGGLTTAGGALIMANRSGVATFSGASFDSGIFNGTTRAGPAVVLTGVSGSYETPLINWDGSSYGRVVSQVNRTHLGTVSYSIVSAAGAVIQPSVQNGGLITVAGSANPSIRVRATMSAASLAASPELLELGAGHSIAGSPTSAAAANSFNGLGLVADKLELGYSVTNFTYTPPGPVVQRVPGTWYAQALGTGTGIVVGTEIWLYVAALEGPPQAHTIGRLVSSDGGVTWVPDAAPLLVASPGEWDSRGVFGARVIWDGGTGWQMWYNGFDASGTDYARVGYATSTDGITWTKYANNPVLNVTIPSSWESQSIYLGGVVKEGSTYYMFYAARNTLSYRKGIGVATSQDGISWTKFGGNPFITFQSASYTDSEAYAGNAYVKDGTFYLYWACSMVTPPQGAGYATCLSTSPDGFTWVLHPDNPIIPYGQNAWAPNSTEGLMQTYNPFTGEPIWLVSSQTFATGEGDIGRVTPSRLSPGSFSATWDLGNEVPRRWTGVTVSGSAPPGTGVDVILAASADGSAFSPGETVDFGGDAQISTVPNRHLRVSLVESTTARALSPSVEGIRIDYDRFAPSGRFTSGWSQAPYNIESAVVALGAAVPPGTAISLEVSNDNGTSWEPAIAGTAHAFSTLGKTFRYRVDLTARSNAAPAVSEVRVSLAFAVHPHDLVLETAGGAELASVRGAITDPVRVPISAAALNALVAPARGNVPAIGVDVDLFAVSSSVGFARFSNLSVDLSFPDELRTFFAPNATRVELLEGGTTLFRILASTTPGVDIDYAWWVDGTQLPLVEANFTFGPQVPGNYTLRATVTNGQFTDEFTWAVAVIANPIIPIRPLVIAFLPLGDVVIRVNETAMFSADLTEPAAPPVTYVWRIYGGPVGHADTGNFTVVPATAGSYAVWVTVRNATGIETHLWNLTVLPPEQAVTPPPGGDQNVAIAGLGNLVWLVLALIGAGAAAVFAVMYIRERQNAPKP